MLLHQEWKRLNVIILTVKMTALLSSPSSYHPVQQILPKPTCRPFKFDLTKAELKSCIIPTRTVRHTQTWMWEWATEHFTYWVISFIVESSDAHVKLIKTQKCSLACCVMYLYLWTSVTVPTDCSPWPRRLWPGSPGAEQPWFWPADAPAGGSTCTFPGSTDP